MIAKCLTKYNGVFYEVGSEIPTSKAIVEEKKTVETVDVVEDNIEEVQPKKKGGRPRKNKE